MRKYAFEFSLNMLCDSSMRLLQHDGLEEIPTNCPDYHIYTICRHPKVLFEPESIKFTANRSTGIFKINRGKSIEEHKFDVRHPYGTDQMEVKCDYPFTHIQIVDKRTGQVRTDGKSALLVRGFGPEYAELLDLEVLYVGQSYGADGKRTAPQRLMSHSTLQKIYAESITRSPEQDIWILLCEFMPVQFMVLDGHDKEVQKTDAESAAHAEKVIDNPISEQQRINFTEAALIKYFQPEFNKVFKDSFPNYAHSTYSECYDVDLNAVSFEIQTECVGARLYSDRVNADWRHVGHFPLHSSKERKDIFDLG